MVLTAHPDHATTRPPADYASHVAHTPASDQQQHLLGLAQQQAADATARLADAGRTIDELRRDAIELATRLAQARTENATLSGRVEELSAELAAERDAAAKLAGERDAAAANTAALEAKVREQAQRLQQDPLRRAMRAIRRK